MLESDARAAGLDVAVAVKQLPSTFRGWLHASSGGIVKLVVDRKTGVLVGASAVGPSGAEMLGVLSLAVHSHLPIAELRSMIYAFPTFYGAIGEAVGAYGLVNCPRSGLPGLRTARRRRCAGALLEEGVRMPGTFRE